MQVSALAARSVPEWRMQEVEPKLIATWFVPTMRALTRTPENNLVLCHLRSEADLKLRARRQLLQRNRAYNPKGARIFAIFDWLPGRVAEDRTSLRFSTPRNGNFLRAAGDFRPKFKNLARIWEMRRLICVRYLRRFFRVSTDKLEKTGLPGWGGRIRTSEWRNQNPLPYRLATPQHCTGKLRRAKRADGRTIAAALNRSTGRPAIIRPSRRRQSRR